MDWGRLAYRVRSFGIELLDAIVPPRAHTVRTKERSFQQIPLFVARHELLDTHITTLMEYRRPEVQDLIRSLKYDGNEYAAYLCGEVLADFLREEIASIRTFSPRPIFIIPLPLHQARQRERGFNQITLALQRLPSEFRDGTLSCLHTTLLIRIRDTAHQTSLARRARIKNMKGAFALTNATVNDAHIFLVDDVTTTGATLRDAAHTLKRISKNVTLVALARA